jgi:hypothetical protein
MDQRMAMFCAIDAFGKALEPVYPRCLLPAGQRHCTRQTTLALSELLTLLVSLHRRHSRTCTHASTKPVEPHRRPYVSTLVRSTRCVELIPRARVPRCGSLHTRAGRCPGIACIAATPWAVCHHRRMWPHKVCEGWATRGKTSLGWL